MTFPTSGTFVAGSPVDRRNNFAVGMALGMLAVNLVGFAPTLYLRPFFDVPPMPGYLYAHGAIGTVWFVFLVVQTMLVANQRVTIHRQLGYVGAVVAVFVMATVRPAVRPGAVVVAAPLRSPSLRRRSTGARAHRSCPCW